MTKSMQLAINGLSQDLCLIVTAKVCSKLSVLVAPRITRGFFMFASLGIDTNA